METLIRFLVITSLLLIPLYLGLKLVLGDRGMGFLRYDLLKGTLGLCVKGIKKILGIS
jgi:hypothetical protein